MITLRFQQKRHYGNKYLLSIDLQYNALQKLQYTERVASVSIRPEYVHILCKHGLLKQLWRCSASWHLNRKLSLLVLKGLGNYDFLTMNRFVCNRWDTYYSITAGSSILGSLAKRLSLLFLTSRPALSFHQHRTLVCLFWSGNLNCPHSPANPTAARQECFKLLDVSNSSNNSFSDT